MGSEAGGGRPEWAPLSVDLDRPSASRIYDFYLGGSHNFRVDRAVAREAIAKWPDLPLIMRENRAFLRRAVRFLTGRGITQFVDIGSGIPTAGNVHEVARAAAPTARVVYVDNDPVAVTHSRTLLDGDPHTAVLQADLRFPDDIFGPHGAGALVDLTGPVAVLMVAILHFIPDADDPAGILARVRERLAPGSFLVVSHASADTDPRRGGEHADLYRRTTTPMTMRTRDQVLRLFDGFELVEPGLVGLTLWRPERAPDAELTRRVPGYAAVGRLPGR